MEKQFEFYLEIYKEQRLRGESYEKLRDQYLTIVFTLSGGFIAIIVTNENVILKVILSFSLIILGVLGKSIVNKMYERYKFRLNRSREIRKLLDVNVNGKLTEVLDNYDNHHEKCVIPIYDVSLDFLNFPRKTRKINNKIHDRILEYSIRSLVCEKEFDQNELKFMKEYLKTRWSFVKFWTILCSLLILIGFSFLITFMTDVYSNEISQFFIILKNK